MADDMEQKNPRWAEFKRLQTWATQQWFSEEAKTAGVSMCGLGLRNSQNGDQKQEPILL